MRLTDFNASDPFDAMAESVRRQVCDIALEMQKAAVYRDLPAHRQIECLMAGLATGVIGVLFAHIQEAGRDDLMDAFLEYLPHARLNAEEILAGHPLPAGRAALDAEGER